MGRSPGRRLRKREVLFVRDVFVRDAHDPGFANKLSTDEGGGVSDGTKAIKRNEKD